MLALEFSHGWVEDGRIFRVEVNPKAEVFNEFNYVFSIDGVKFEQMPNKPVGTVATVATTPAPTRVAEKKTPTVNIKVPRFQRLRVVEWPQQCLNTRGQRLCVCERLQQRIP